MSARRAALACVVAASIGCAASPESARDAGDLRDAGASDAGPPDAGFVFPPDASTFVVMTINAGTTSGLPHDLGEAEGTGDGYTSEMATIADALYENSLSWNPAERALTAFLMRERPAIVGFQELYYDPWCETITVDPALDFVCRDYVAGAPLQVERLLGGDYAIACGTRQVDNCIAVRRDFGAIRGCATGACVGGLEGGDPPSGCSRGERMGRVVVDLVAGGTLVVVNAHGTSGIDAESRACRVDQFRQVFEDRGDGSGPLADGELNVVLGDFNTDPVTLTGSDESAAYLAAQTAPGSRFHFVTATARDAPATYGGLFRIDHVISDAFVGRCTTPGVTPGVAAVTDAIYWDHKPAVCRIYRP